MRFGNSTPILRIFDVAKAKEFYVDYLGFDIDWENRLAENSPLYMQISLDDCLIHLSEHHGDSSPGAAVRIEATDLDAYHSELLAKPYQFAKPGIDTTEWKTRETAIKDPFGNKIIFWTPVY